MIAMSVSWEAKGRWSLAWLLLCAIASPGCAPRSAWLMQPDGRMNYRDISESSGLAVSLQYDDVMWTHNDSRNAADLFAVTRRGRLIRHYQVPGAVNNDWEDISLDDQGNLYIFDNTSRNVEQGYNEIYILPEPDPRKNEPIREVRKVRIHFPTSAGPFDCEAMFVWKGMAYLITKPWDGSLPQVYRASDLQLGGVMDFIGEIPVYSMITGADISADGKRIALTSYRALLVFEGQDNPEHLLASPPLVAELNARQIEAVAWRDDHILLTNEQREIFELSPSRWRNQNAPFLRRPEASVPWVSKRPSVHIPLEKWARGEWLEVRLEAEPARVARAIWNPEGLHIGVELPSDIVLHQLGLNLSKGFDDWFLPGILYLMINPDGDRPIAYGENDRCLVFSRNGDGRPAARALYLRPATLIQSQEDTPDWIRILESRADNRLLITITPEAPGFGQLQEKRQIGFNLILIRGNSQLVSWAPLTRIFSFDQPNVWGLLDLEK